MRADSQTLAIDGRRYTVQVLRHISMPLDSPRLIVVARQPNQQAQDILRVCIESVRYFTSRPHELWIVDNNSPYGNADWLRYESGINVVLNMTDPVPPGQQKFWRRIRTARQQIWGSYANAIGLEIGRRVIDPASRYMMTLHMDTMPCHPGWLPFLLSKLRGNVAAAGVRMDTARTPEGVLHVLGYLVDFQRFLQLGLDFFPDLPRYDVGDKVTVRLRKEGFEVFACRNTLWEPDLIDQLPTTSPFRSLQVDRSFDDQGNIIFLHLGRGVRKSTQEHTAGTSPQQWIQFAKDYMGERP